ncbi:MAG: glycosyltransferase family 2 protein [Ruminococcaceae bacterium]|nr:glycosyltransferase family 2 protein [Oscillospiraceae bacterium]
MFEKVPIQEKSFRGFLKRLVLRLKEHPRIFAFLRFFIVAIRKIRRKLNRLVGGFAVRYKISGRRRKTEASTVFDKNVCFSIVVPLYNTPIKFLREMIKSVQNQTYANWQLCLADGSDNEHSYVGEYVTSINDSRIRYKRLEKNMGIADNTNACIEMADGDYIALFDHDDLLHPSALFEMAMVAQKGADFIYTDEVTFVGKPSNITIYNFKPDFSPDTLRSYNYICHFTAFSKELLDMVGCFNREYDGSQDYDLILRLTEKAKCIAHIPKALYFWRSHKASVASDVSAKPYVVESAKRALLAHIKRLGLSGRVEDATVPTTYKIQYDIIGEPLVSIIIPNKDHTEDLEKCLSSVYEKSTYKNFEVIVVENNSTEPETFEYYKTAQSKYNNLRVITWESGFNYSAINNFAVEQAGGDYILLLNNDIEVITSDWIEQMLMFAQRKEVGAVGSKLYYEDDTIQHAGVIVGLGGVAGHSHKGFARDNPGYMARASIAQNLSACTAACLMIRKDVYNEVSGLDEGYAVAFNDIDFCMKIRAAGYLIVFTPFAEFYHYESKSRGDEDTPEKRARFNSEIFRFQERWETQLKAGDPYYNPNLSLDSEDFELR